MDILVWSLLILITCECFQLNYAFQEGTDEYWNYIQEYAKGLKLQESSARQRQNKLVYDLTLPETIEAAEEKEDWVSQLESKYANTHEKYGEFKNAKALEDSATDEEKSKTTEPLFTNKIVVDAYENFSNTLNKAVDAPWNFFGKAWNKWIKFTDFLGSKVFQLNHKLQD